MAWKGAYDLIYEGFFNNKIKIKKYISRVTRLKIAFAHVPGPLVHGKFSLATEDASDDGLPHILEHVIFLGSEDYPHKGVLDKVATRCFSNGTNATTDTDVTIYEVTTAGQEGFFNILPIYLEHILFPTLSDAAYLTEVHHVDGKGRDAGTVYSEMQERENSADDLVDLALRRALYPSPLCGYRFNTGGLLQNIRDSTNNDKVKDFHRRFYRPENLCLVLVGEVAEEKLFQVLSAFEEKVVSKGLSPSFKRPWQTPVEPLTTSSSVQVLFPSDEEDEGEVTVAWRGPNVNDSYQLTAASLLLDYLQDSAVSPLNQAFVEIAKPLCAEIGYSVFENLETALVLSFSSVPVQHLALIQPKLMQVLLQVQETGFDMQRMASIIKNRGIQTFNNLENDPASTLTNDLTIDFLYACSNTHTEERLNVKASLERLSREDASFWTTLLSSTLLSKPHVTVVAKPSTGVAKEHEKEEEARIRARLQQLDKEGLLHKASLLASAIEENEKPIPEEMLLAIKIPSLSSIQHHPISTFSNHTPTHSKGVSLFDSDTQSTLNELPLSFHLHDIDTAFVTINILMDASGLPKHLLPYLTLFNELLFESPLRLQTGLLDYKEVVAKLVEETVEHTASVGLSGDRFVAGEFASYVHLNIKVEQEKYREGVRWCADLLTGVVFTQDRLRSVASKCLGDAKSEKKDARVVMEQLNILTAFQKDSPMSATSMLKQLPFLKALLARKDNKKDLESLQEVAKGLLGRGGMLVNLTANVAQLTARPNGDGAGSDVWQVWQEGFVDRLVETGTSHLQVWPAIRDLNHLLPPATKAPHVLVALASTDSSYLTLHTASISDFRHPDYPSFLALCYFINMLEGPVWRAIRGNGLAYGFGLHLDLNQGLNFRLLGSTNLVEAFRHANSFMNNLCDGKVQISQSELECARCDCIFELLSMQATPHLAADRALLCTLRDLPQDLYSTLIEQVAATTSEQLLRMACVHLKPLFSAGSRAVITCPTSQASSIAKSFLNSFQMKFTVYKSVDKVPL